jgi:hypothetical protein
MKCYYLRPDGKCDGRYKDLGCIGSRCRAEKDPPCPHYDQGFYCTKFRRFGCVGLSNCTGSIDEYMKLTRPRAKV